MKSNCCSCVDGKIKTSISRTMRIGFIDLQCPCTCHQEKPMKDKELDLAEETRELAYCENQTYSGKIYAYWRVKKLIKEVERLREILGEGGVKHSYHNERVAELQKENATLLDKSKNEIAEMDRLVSLWNETAEAIKRENAKLQEEVKKYKKESLRFQEYTKNLEGK